MATNTTATATPFAQAAPIIAPKSISLTQDAWRRFIRNKAALAGLVFIGIIVFSAIFAPFIAPYHYATQDIRATTEGIGSPGHLLGTDRLGRDILNTLAVVIVAATLGIPAAILGEAGISFIGLGINPPVPSWGLMISEGIADLRSYPYMLISPAVVLSLTVLSFNFIGDGLRDAFDPWMKK